MRRLTLGAALLVLPLAALLLAQWPLRDLVQAFSRQANDIAQILFALYMAVAVTAASRAGTHLCAHRPRALAPRLRAWLLFLCTAPWALFMLWAGTGPAIASLRQAERFGETLTPGYFLIRWALWLLALLVLVDAAASLLRQHRRRAAP
ncbi:C4-dicarboxylate ABC transporter substrate-binding protein [Caenimonas terrae]|uniref:C4-dicarboxylate ABC transporter substrate-binding protein n=1 Tax=Caenimonas terrae TaxID=696074 RepID=A0ABW0N7J7_9BURK